MLGGAGLGGDGNGECVGAASVLFGCNHELGELFGDLFGDGPVEFFRLRLVEDGEVLGGFGFHQVRLHADTVVGDGGGDDGVLEGGEGDVALADGGLGEGGGVGNVADGAGHFVDADVVGFSYAEGFGGVLEFPDGEFAGEVSEGDVAGVGEGHAEGAAAAVFAAVVFQWGDGVGEDRAGGVADVGVGVDAFAEQRGGGDDLEGGSGRQGFSGGAVDERGGPHGAQLLVVVVDGGVAEAGEGGGVVAGAGGEGEDGAGGGLDGDDTAYERAGSDTGLQGVPGGFLHVGFDGEGDVAAAGVAAGEEVNDAVSEEFVVLAGEDGVFGVFDAGARVEAEVAGDGGPHVGVLAVDAVEFLGGFVVVAGGEDYAVGGDLAALAAELGELGAGEVARVVAQFGGVDDLHPGEVEEEDNEEYAGEDDDSADGLIHCFPPLWRTRLQIRWWSCRRHWIRCQWTWCRSLRRRSCRHPRRTGRRAVRQPR